MEKRIVMGNSVRDYKDLDSDSEDDELDLPVGDDDLDDEL